MTELSLKDVKRFLAKIDRTNQNGCWRWTSDTLAKGGYGRFSVRGKTYRAHRISYSMTHPDLKEDLEVLHTCDNPACVRPSHLIAGTHLQNMEDMSGKARSKNPNGIHRLSMTAELKKAVKEDSGTLEALSEKYGYSIARIFTIRGKKF